MIGQLPLPLLDAIHTLLAHGCINALKLDRIAPTFCLFLVVRLDKIMVKSMMIFLNLCFVPCVADSSSRRHNFYWERKKNDSEGKSLTFIQSE